MKVRHPRIFPWDEPRLRDTIVSAWRQGHDTRQIAFTLRCPEARVWAVLGAERDLQRDERQRGVA